MTSAQKKIPSPWKESFDFGPWYSPSCNESMRCVHYFGYRRYFAFDFYTRANQTNAPRPFCKAAKGLGCFHFDTRLRENMRLADFVPIAEFARQSMCEHCGVSSNSPTTLRASRIPRSARVRRPHIAPRSACRARRSSPRPSSPSCPPPRPPNACSRR